VIIYEVQGEMLHPGSYTPPTDTTWFPTSVAAGTYVLNNRWEGRPKIRRTRIPTTPKGMCDFLNRFAGC
jgi:hypothetical protein